jgi:enterochelin esterase-like enzyme
MSTRQAAKWTNLLLSLLTFITACSPSKQPVPASTPFLPASTPQPQAVDTAAPSTITPIPLSPGCLSKPGRVTGGKVDSTKPPQAYLIYLPPCYDEQPDKHYPVLYLLHGQTYTDDQWIRLGAASALDQLIISGEAQPFIIVFPDDRYWNVPAGAGFGDRLVNALVPYIDQTYRTIPDRRRRAIGGLSRGSGWALQLGLTRWDLFSIIGLHSLAVLQGDGSQIEKWIQKIPPIAYPTIFMDSGDNDPELAMALTVESTFSKNGIPNEWHLFSGAHTEEYWSAHTAEYISWYANQWNTP